MQYPSFCYTVFSFQMNGIKIPSDTILLDEVAQ